MQPIIKKCLDDLRDAGKFNILLSIKHYTESAILGKYSYWKGVSKDGQKIAWSITHITIQQWRNAMNHSTNSELQEIVDYIDSI